MTDPDAETGMYANLRLTGNKGRGGVGKDKGMDTGWVWPFSRHQC